MEAEGAEHLSEALKTNKTLNSLYIGTALSKAIGNNNIGIEGTKSISDAIRFSNTLNSLELGKLRI